MKDESMTVIQEVQEESESHSSLTVIEEISNLNEDKYSSHGWDSSSQNSSEYSEIKSVYFKSTSTGRALPPLPGKKKTKGKTFKLFAEDDLPFLQSSLMKKTTIPETELVSPTSYPLGKCR